MLSNWIDIERVIHSTKTAIACLIGYGLTKVIAFQTNQWIIITILVVMCSQIYVGGVLQKGYLRFLGTLTGCILAILTLKFAGHSSTAIAITLGYTSFLFSYMATGNEKFMYASMLGAVTIAIILLGQNPSITQAVERFLEISIGILIATLISQFVLPIHAKTHLKRTQIKTLTALRDYYTACIVTEHSEAEASRFEEFDENIVKLLSKQRLLAKDAKRELLGAEFDPEHCVILLQCEKEILRSIDFMHIAKTNCRQTKTFFSQTPALQVFNQSIVDIFNHLLKIMQRKSKEEVSVVIPSLKSLKEDYLANFPNERERIYHDSFIFAAESLVNNLSRLAGLYQSI